MQQSDNLEISQSFPLTSMVYECDQIFSKYILQSYEFVKKKKTVAN